MSTSSPFAVNIITGDNCIHYLFFLKRQGRSYLASLHPVLLCQICSSLSISSAFSPPLAL
jgi:hypothetical protein